MTIRQLQLCKISLQFFSQCYQSSTIWKVLVANIPKVLISKVLRMIGLFTLLLGIKYMCIYR